MRDIIINGTLDDKEIIDQLNLETNRFKHVRERKSGGSHDLYNYHYVMN